MAIFTVDTALDIVDAGDGLLSLREAVILANDTAGVDRIAFEASVFDGEGSDVIRLSSQITITDALTIDGGPAGVTIQSGNPGRIRLFEITDADAATTLAHLTLRGGGGAFGFAGRDGGAVRSEADLTVQDSILENNGALVASAVEGKGGAIFGLGAVTVTNSTFNRNFDGEGGGGGIYARGPVTVANSTFSDNSGKGGGIYGLDAITVTDSTFHSNRNGAIYGLGAITVANSTFSDSGRAIDGRDAVAVTNSTFSGNRSGGLYALGDVTVTNSTFSGNETSADGGGIYSKGAITLTDSIVLGNRALGFVPGYGAQGGEAELLGLDGLAFTGANIVGANATAFDASAFDNVVNAAPEDVFAEVDASGAGVLADNGGPTETILILAGGAAHDGAGAAGELTTDQRGEARPVGAPDIGAVELVEALSLVVTTAADVVAVDGVTSLREAIAFANQRDADGDGDPADTITFDAGVFDGGQDAVIRLQDGQFEITEALTIDGGPHGVMIDAQRDSRLFHITEFDAVTTLARLTLTGGFADDSAGRRGGAVRSDADLTVMDSAVVGNSAAYGGGVLMTNTTIDKLPSVTVINSTFSDNSAGYGGGLYSSGALTVTNSTFSGNDVVITPGVGFGGGGRGGGLFALRGGTVTNSTFSGNSADRIAGALSGSVTITDSILLGNTAGLSDPEISGTVTFDGANIVGANAAAFNANVSGNVVNAAADAVFAQVDAGGAGVLADNGGLTETILILRGGAAQDVAGAAGGAETDQRGAARPVGAPDIGAVELQEAPSLVVTTAADVVDASDGLTSLREAVAFANAGDADGDGDAADTVTFDAGVFDGEDGDVVRLTGEIEILEALTIDGGPAGVTIDGQDNGRLFNVTDADADTTLARLTLTGGSVDGDGGAVRSRADLSVRDSVVTGNSAGYGGGGLYAGGAVTVANSTISDNSAGSDGAPGFGGGLTAAGYVTVLDSTISGNTASTSGGGVYGFRGVEATNSTVSGNSAGIAGGGLFGFRAVTVTNGTISGNSAGSSGGGVFGGGYGGATITLTDSIVLGNGAADRGAEVFVSDSFGAADVAFDGANIVGADAAAFDASVSDNVMNAAPADVFATVDGAAGVLADNGGPTETILILAGGSAQDVDRAAGLVAEDQRGAVRPAVTGFDLGAVELQAEARSLVVTTAADVVDATDGVTSLREAIAFANAGDADGDGDEADTVTFDAAVFDGAPAAVIGLTGEIGIAEALTIDGGEAGVTIDGLQNGRLFAIDAVDAPTTFARLTLTGGGTESAGGAVLSFSDVTLENSVVTGNRADYSAGGILTLANAETTVINSTISDNSTDGAGGGLFTRAATVINSTISGNSAGGAGGGLYGLRGAVTVTNSTISGNEAGSGGGLSFGAQATGVLTDSIVLGNRAATADAEIGGAAAFTGANIVGADAAAFDARVSENVVNAAAADVFAVVDGAGAGALADNGGPTETILILTGGAAQDVAGAAGGLAADQRGAARPVGASDIGAVELQDSPAALTLALVPDSVAEGAAATLTLTRGGDTAAPLRVVLASDDETEATLPATARFEAGENEVTVTVTVEARTDGVVDGDQTVTITAGGPGVIETRVDLTVADVDVPTNTAPSAAADRFATDEDTRLDAVAPGVLDNDEDAEDDELTAALVDDVDNGVLVLNPDGSFTYDPNPDFFGEDRFTYRAFDGALQSETVAVVLTVNPVDDAPVNTVPQALTVAEDAALAIAGVSAADVDGDLASTALSVENGALTVTLAGAAAISAGANGSRALTLSGTEEDINATLASLVYQGDADFNGSDTLTVVSTDAAETPLSDTDTVAITVTPVNDAPEVTPVTAAFGEDETGRVVNLFAGAFDADGDDLAVDPDSVTLTTGARTIETTLDAEAGTLAIADGQFDDLASDQPLTFTVTFDTTDGLTAAPNTATVTIRGVNDAPVARDVSVTGGEDDPSVPVSLFDAQSDVDDDPSALSAVIVEGPSFGVLELQDDGAFRYVGDAERLDALPEGETLFDSFTFELVDDDGAVSEAATASIFIEGVNDAPVANDDAGDSFRAAAGEVAIVDGLTDNDVDPEGDPLTVAAVSPTTALGAAVTLLDDGRVEVDYTGVDITPDSVDGQTALDSFVYTATDGDLVSNPATVSLTVSVEDDDAQLVVAALAGVRRQSFDLGDEAFLLDIGPIGDDGTRNLLTVENFGADDSVSFTLEDVAFARSSRGNLLVRLENRDSLLLTGVDNVDVLFDEPGLLA